MSTAPPVLRFRPILFYPWLLLLLGPVIAVVHGESHPAWLIGAGLLLFALTFLGIVHLALHAPQVRPAAVRALVVLAVLAVALTLAGGQPMARTFYLLGMATGIVFAAGSDRIGPLVTLIVATAGSVTVWLGDAGDIFGVWYLTLLSATTYPQPSKKPAPETAKRLSTRPTKTAGSNPRPRPPTKRSVDAFDDAEVALDAVGEGGQRLLVGRTLVRRDGLLEAVELDQDGALGNSGVMRHDPTATDDGPTAPGPDGRTGQLVVSGQLLRVGNGAVRADPVALGHRTSSGGMSGRDWLPSHCFGLSRSWLSSSTRCFSAGRAAISASTSSPVSLPIKRSNAWTPAWRRVRT